MKKKTITYDDIIKANLVSMENMKREHLSFSITHGLIWENSDVNPSYCGLLLYIPLQKELAEKILKMLQEEIK